jgi:hypothetical protein
LPTILVEDDLAADIAAATVCVQGLRAAFSPVESHFYTQGRAQRGSECDVYHALIGDNNMYDSSYSSRHRFTYFATFCSFLTLALNICAGPAIAQFDDLDAAPRGLQFSSQYNSMFNEYCAYAFGSNSTRGTMLLEQRYASCSVPGSGPADLVSIGIDDVCHHFFNADVNVVSIPTGRLIALNLTAGLSPPRRPSIPKITARPGAGKRRQRIVYLLYPGARR